MVRLVQVVVDGIANGFVYAALALALELIVIRPVEGCQPLILVIVILGLFIFINNGAGWIWGFSNRGFSLTFSEGTVGVGGVRLSIESLGIVAVLLVVVGLLFLLF